MYTNKLARERIDIGVMAISFSTYSTENDDPFPKMTFEGFVGKLKTMPFVETGT
jgi:hypothetical protein